DNSPAVALYSPTTGCWEVRTVTSVTLTGGNTVLTISSRIDSTTTAGTLVVGNIENGIFLNANGGAISSLTIGGDASKYGNSIYANTKDGILVGTGAYTGTVIGSSNEIGLNKLSGIELASGGATSLSITGNFIGTSADGTTDKTAIRAEDWHTDDSYFAVPAKATLLHSIEIPSRGGSTWFCNMHSVYDALPEATKQRIDGKRAMHGYDTPRARNRPSARTPQEIAETPDVEHPLVRTHPVTGRKALYLNPNRLDRIVGLERSESDALLDELADEARKPQHHFGHVWQVGDIVVWDNRATMHRVMIDYPVGETRIMQRVLIEGEPPI
ncbi:MAG: TauD/TfdA family dioxygenase, partial [Chloroflexota bacterium]